MASLCREKWQARAALRAWESSQKRGSVEEVLRAAKRVLILKGDDDKVMQDVIETTEALERSELVQYGGEVFTLEKMAKAYGQYDAVLMEASGQLSQKNLISAVRVGGQVIIVEPCQPGETHQPVKDVATSTWQDTLTLHQAAGRTCTIKSKHFLRNY